MSSNNSNFGPPFGADFIPNLQYISDITQAQQAVVTFGTGEATETTASLAGVNSRDFFTALGVPSGSEVVPGSVSFIDNVNLIWEETVPPSGYLLAHFSGFPSNLQGTINYSTGVVAAFLGQIRIPITSGTMTYFSPAPNVTTLNYFVGQWISFRIPPSNGMIQLNNQKAKILAINGASVTINVDTTQFYPFISIVDPQFPCVAVPAGSGIYPETATVILDDAFDNQPIL